MGTVNNSSGNGALKNGPEKYTILVDTKKIDESLRELVGEISAQVIGQPRAIEHLLRLFATEDVGLRDPDRPIGVMILPGPSGCGKTLTALETARAFLGHSSFFKYPVTRVQCSNFTDRHHISSFLGSPPGYIGYHDLPILHKFNIEKYHLLIILERAIKGAKDPYKKDHLEKTLQFVWQVLNSGGLSAEDERNGQARKKQILGAILEQYQPLNSIILFDEIEKAHPNIWNMLLGIMEEGQLQLADGFVTDFRNSFIMLTTNIGSREILGLMKKPIGFSLPTEERSSEQLDQKIYEEARNALRKMFPAEFVGRLGKEIVVFRTLGQDDYLKILDLFLTELQNRLSGKKLKPFPILLSFSQNFREFLIQKGTSREYGARILRDIVKKYVESPLAFAISSGELTAGDKVLFVLENGEPVLRRRPRPEKMISDGLPAEPRDSQEPEEETGGEPSVNGGNGNGSGLENSNGQEVALLPTRTLSNGKSAKTGKKIPRKRRRKYPPNNPRSP